MVEMNEVFVQNAIAAKIFDETVAQFMAPMFIVKYRGEKFYVVNGGGILENNDKQYFFEVNDRQYDNLFLTTLGLGRYMTLGEYDVASLGSEIYIYYIDKNQPDIGDVFISALDKAREMNIHKIFFPTEVDSGPHQDLLRFLTQKITTD